MEINKRAKRVGASAAIALCLLCAGTAATAAPPSGATEKDDGAPTKRPLERHMEKMTTGAGFWRAANPDYAEGEGSPEYYGIRFHLSPDKTYADGELFGLFPDGGEVRYWTLITLYNPVTKRVITQQIGANGAYLRGENRVQTGDRQVIDMIAYAPTGDMELTRHVIKFLSDDVHQSDAYAFDKNGAWSLKAEWTWERVN